MAQFPFITDGIHGDVPINMYPTPDSERGTIMQSFPGLSTFCTLTNCTEVRGLHTWDPYLYVVARRWSKSILWRVDQAGSASALGELDSSASGPVWIEHNTANQLCVVDGVWGWIYNRSTGSFDRISDVDFPGAAAMAYQDGYGLFIQPGSNQWFFSSLFDFSTFNARDFYARSTRPDNLVGILSFQREPFVFGEIATEVYYNAGGGNTSATDQTFALNTGGVMEYGCGAVGSPSTVDGTAATWLSNKGQIVHAAGYSAKPVMNQMFDRAVKGYSRFDDAVALAYRDQGHLFYQISFPTADKTWVLDATTGMFCKRQSLGNDGVNQGRHRANCYAMWNNKHWVGDFSNGKIYEMGAEYYDDAGAEIQRVLHTKEIEGGMARTYFPPVQLLLEPGVGLLGGRDPQVMLQFSDDSGKTWSSEYWRSAGALGQYGYKTVWHRLGSGYRRIYKLTMTDPVLWRILGIDYTKEAG